MDQIIVRDGKGKKDRNTIFPDDLKSALRDHLKYTKALHEKDLSDGYGSVYMPYALGRKFKKAEKIGVGNMCFPQNPFQLIPGPAKSGAIIFT